MDALTTYHFAMIAVFLGGYGAIIFEHRLHINKGGAALLLAGTLWLLYFAGIADDPHAAAHQISEHLSEVSQIVFFLLGAMTLVEVIDSHGAFRLVTDQIRTRSKWRVMWILAVLAFFMSAMLDNLTTTIVMVSLLRRILPNRDNRLLLGSMVVIAANAGGAWTPMGDVTTTMLWIGGQVTTTGVMTALFVPSLVAMIVAVVLLGVREKGGHFGGEAQVEQPPVHVGARRVLSLGLGAFVAVPVLKTVVHLPPFVGILLGLGVMWLVTDRLHRADEGRAHVKVAHAFTKIDVSGVLFFLGILLGIGALESAGLLTLLAQGLDATTDSPAVLAGIIGVLSAIIDNVPLVAATMGMYPVEVYPVDGRFWDLIALCAGTGGSILIIGSAAGVALMGMEKVDFMWYLRRISWIALVSYLAGMATYIGLAALG
ncbi:citrate transporter [Plesiocystis pacifica SIR-1]|uniref:Citrate transporter n=1 Tax=Plesiocystis pacifica SIR-1 TaxID=391625 RepID=A6FYY1_9BACT|nr:sodium:proton antiporter NhaD [Plesiocystis pacifica]EDM81136.1 citrate transporter [Plesiocystis pacifica SIR-1]